MVCILSLIYFNQMEKLNHPAILVVDMLNDFVTGALGCDRARAIVPATARLLEEFPSSIATTVTSPG